MSFVTVLLFLFKPYTGTAVATILSLPLLHFLITLWILISLLTLLAFDGTLTHKLFLLKVDF